MSGPLSIARRVALPVCGFSTAVILGMLMLPDGYREKERPPGRGASHAALTVEDVRLIIPGDWDVVTSRRRSGGWQQTGRIKGSPGEAYECVSSLMEAHGYELVSSIAGPSDDGGGLYAYGNSGGTGRVLWSLWPAGRGCTGFAWGIER